MARRQVKDQKMTKTFRMFENRKDKALMGFSANDNAALLACICANSATGHVRQMTEGGPVSVPKHTAEIVRAHLIKQGWAPA